MKYFFDTEFHEYHKRIKFLGIPIGRIIPTIDMISIGIVSEDIEKTLMPPTDTYNETVKTDREYYAISKDFNIKDAWNSYQLGSKNNKVYWLRENVLISIFDELSNKETNRLFTNKNTIFNLKNFTRLIKKYGKTNKQIAEEIKEFIIQDDNNYKDLKEKTILSARTLGKNLRVKNILSEHNDLKFDNPKFYAYYADYDWVVFCQLFGKMINLPKGFPMYCIDLKQELESKWSKFRSGYKTYKDMDSYPKQENKHNALDDAIFNKKLYKFLQTL